MLAASLKKVEAAQAQEEVQQVSGHICFHFPTYEPVSSDDLENYRKTNQLTSIVMKRLVDKFTLDVNFLTPKPPPNFAPVFLTPIDVGFRTVC